MKVEIRVDSEYMTYLRVYIRLTGDGGLVGTIGTSGMLSLPSTVPSAVRRVFGTVSHGTVHCLIAIWALSRALPVIPAFGNPRHLPFPSLVSMLNFVL
jgi:hypothetical protein